MPPKKMPRSVSTRPWASILAATSVAANALPVAVRISRREVRRNVLLINRRALRILDSLGTLQCDIFYFLQFRSRIASLGRRDWDGSGIGMEAGLGWR